MPTGPRRVDAAGAVGVAFEVPGGTVPDARAHVRAALAALRKRGGNGSR